MEHTYHIEGMTCSSCVKKVTEALKSLSGVIGVQVDLEKKEAKVTMKNHVRTDLFSAALKKIGDYSIKEKGHHMADMISSDPEEESYSYRPLFMVLGFILLIVLISEYNHGEFEWMRAMRNYMGGFFIAFSFFKLLDLKGFAYSYLSYDIISKKWLGWGFVYPFIELGLGIAYLSEFQSMWTAILTILVMGLSSVGVIRAVLDDQKIKCACLGTGFNLPMSTVTIIEDLVMVIMAGILLMFY